MGIFSKLKKMFGGTEEEKEEKVVDETLESEEEIDDENLEDSEVEDDEEEITEEDNIDEEVEPLTEEKKEKVKIYDKGLSKSRGGFVSKLQDLTRRYSKINEDYFDELEEILIMADVGVNTVMELIEKLKKRVNDDKITDPEELKEVLVDEMFIIYVNDEILTNKINYNDKDISVILFV
jgi:signal recognition particle GTPase